jgi:hypothetical protein
MRTIMQGVLREAHWSEPDATLYAMAELLSKIMMNTMEWYFCMMLHFRMISPNDNVFERVGQLHLKFHVDQLMQIWI